MFKNPFGLQLYRNAIQLRQVGNCGVRKDWLFLATPLLTVRHRVLRQNSRPVHQLCDGIALVRSVCVGMLVTVLYNQAKISPAIPPSISPSTVPIATFPIVREA